MEKEEEIIRLLPWRVASGEGGAAGLQLRVRFVSPPLE
jgi:hypothetical protein